MERRCYLVPKSLFCDACNAMDSSPPVSPAYRISQARILGCHFLLQGIFPTLGSNPHLLHCRQVSFH